MRLATHEDIPDIIEYISRELPRCLYMYADITVYGIDDPNLDVWFDRDGAGICRVVMRYHQNFQIYSDRDFCCVTPILRLIQEYRPNGVSGRKELIEALARELSGQYDAVYGVVFKGREVDAQKAEYRLAGCTEQITRATEEDAGDIAALICLDKALGSVYTEESLAEELRERMRTGMGRSYIIRKGSRVVAHNATYAETDRFAVVSGLMVHPDYRNTEYTEWIEQKSMMEITREQKEYYFFASGRKIIRCHNYIGHHPAAEYGKLSRRDISGRRHTEEAEPCQQK